MNNELLDEQRLEHFSTGSNGAGVSIVLVNYGIYAGVNNHIRCLHFRDKLTRIGYRALFELCSRSRRHATGTKSPSRCPSLVLSATQSRFFTTLFSKKSKATFKD